MAKKNRRIGFVDYDLENFHANVYLAALRGPLEKRGFTVAGCTAMKDKAGRTWAKKNGVPYCDDAAALNAECDVFMVLAPSNPETHLALCKTVLPFGKTTYVDKTFAPNLATARKIFALADRHGAAMQTSSALRYTAVQQHVAECGKKNVSHMAAWGPGGSFDEYAIHPVELVVSCMGSKAVSLMRRGAKKFSQLLINYSGGRTAVVNVHVHAKTPFFAAVTAADETRFMEISMDTPLPRHSLRHPRFLRARTAAGPPRRDPHSHAHSGRGQAGLRAASVRLSVTQGWLFTKSL